MEVTSRPSRRQEMGSLLGEASAEVKSSYEVTWAGGEETRCMCGCRNECVDKTNRYMYIHVIYVCIPRLF